MRTPFQSFFVEYQLFSIYVVIGERRVNVYLVSIVFGSLCCFLNGFWIQDSDSSVNFLYENTDVQHKKWSIDSTMVFRSGSTKRKKLQRNSRVVVVAIIQSFSFSFTL